MFTFERLVSSSQTQKNWFTDLLSLFYGIVDANYYMQKNNKRSRVGRRAEFYLPSRGANLFLLLNCPFDAHYDKSECWQAQFFLRASVNTFFFSFPINLLHCQK